jgi:hypothetical protein
LHDNRAITIACSLFGTSEYFIGVHSVSCHIFIVSGKPTIGTPANAIVADLDQSAKMNSVSDGFFSYGIRCGPKLFELLFIYFTKPVFDLFNKGFRARSKTPRL